VAEPGELSANDDDYGYGLDTDRRTEAVSMASRQESAVKIKVMHNLDNPSKELELDGISACQGSICEV